MNTSTSIKSNPRSFLLAVMVAAGSSSLLGQDSALASKQMSAIMSTASDSTSHMDIRDVSATETLHITVGHSTVLHGVSPLKRIYIGNPTVLQSFTAGPSEIVLTAKGAGVSSLVIWDTIGQSRLYTVAADVDADALRQSMQQAFPGSRIDVDGREGRIYLSGTVPSQVVSDGAMKMAAPFSKEIVNSLLIVPGHEKQVQLKLRIVEVDRNKIEQYGLNIAGTSLTTPFNITTGQYPSTITQTPPVTGQNGANVPSTTVVSDMLNLFLYSTKLNFGATIKALEQKQVLQILAEPTLTALSGQSAKFLSGGEFPFPVVQSSSAGVAPTISISFRPYGVKVDFMPIVNPDGTIRLKVTPEVSTLDYSNAVSISGFTVPALAVRRAETEVEIQSGQSFAVSGLLDHRTIESLSQIPGISKIPILGKLFVTKAYTHSLVELMVLVTATVVDPLSDQTKPVEPAMIMPNLNKEKFDKDLQNEKILKTDQ